jgi:hypothetical protein
MLPQPGSTAHCNALDKNNLTVILSHFSHKITVDNFGNPWDMRVSTESFSLSQINSQFIDIGYYYTKLQTEARQFGIGGQPDESKKLLQNLMLKTKNIPFHPFVGHFWMN